MVVQIRCNEAADAAPSRLNFMQVKALAIRTLIACNVKVGDLSISPLPRTCFSPSQHLFCADELGNAFHYAIGCL